MQFLEQLQLHKKNEGSSTGTVWHTSQAEYINSLSPVDNKEIGAVRATDTLCYEKDRKSTRLNSSH